MNKTKNLLYAILLSFLVFTFCLCNINVNTYDIFATTSNAEHIDLSSDIDNNSFKTNNGKSLTTSVKGWSTTNRAGSATAGEINVTSENDTYHRETYYLDSYDLPEKKGDDEKVLMINSNNAKIDVPTWQSFKQNSSIKLDSFSHYILSVYVQTRGNAKASIVLNDFDSSKTIKNEYYKSGIKTAEKEWQKITFLIATGETSQNIKIELFLGDLNKYIQPQPCKGVVFFDEITLTKCSNRYFTQQSNELTNANSVIFDRFDVTPDDLNFDFENNLDNWTKIGNNFDKNYSAKIITLSASEFGDDFVYNQHKGLELSAIDKDNAVNVGYKSSNFTIKTATDYLITVYVKTKNLSGNAHINLVEADTAVKNGYIDKTSENATLSIGSTLSNQLTNDYQLYYIYVSGYELFDTDVYLELLLGNSDNTAYGTVIFSNITIQEISHSTYSNASNGTATTTKDFTIITNDMEFKNGFFTNATKESVDKNYPLVPAEWEQKQKQKSYSSQELNKFGVLNTAKWDKIDINPKPRNPKNPPLSLIDDNFADNDDNSANNVLMIYNINESYQTIKSPKITISRNSYYDITFNYWVQSAKQLNLKLVDSNDNIVFKDEKILGSSSWQTYKISLKTEYFDTNLYLEFDYGTEDDPQKGVVYLDNFILTNNSDNSTNFDNAVDKNLKYIDFSNIGMHLIGEEIKDNDNLFEALMFDVAGNDGGLAGIINEDHEDFPTTNTSEVKNMLMIETLNPNKDVSLTSKDSIALITGSYYKFSVNIKTFFENLDLKNLDNVKTQNFGAYFSISGLENATISNIQTSDDFSLYTIYVYCDADVSAKFKFGMISDSLNTKGFALFDSFKYSTIEQSEYKAVTENKNNIIINKTSVKEETPINEDDTTNTNQNVNVWIMLSTIVMVLAFVVAVVGSILRKVEIKKIKVKRKIEYDRQATLIKDVALIEAEKRRNIDIKEIEKEKEDLNKYIEELDEDNKKRLQEQRKTSGNQITRYAEKEFKIYAHSRQKAIKDIEKLDKKIAEANSPEYLLRIVKIVQAEKIKEVQSKKQPEQQNNTEIDEKNK